MNEFFALNDFRKKFESGEIYFEEYSISLNAEKSYWHSSIIENDRPKSSGFSSAKGKSRNISVNEYFERSLVQSFKKTTSRNDWKLNEYPTGCGFAVSQKKDLAVVRSLAEAIERWSIGLWIEEGLQFDEVNTPNLNKDELSVWKFFQEHFKAVLCFSKTVGLLINSKIYEYQVFATICLTEQGVYPGFSVKSPGKSPWVHAMVESYRHFLAAKNLNLRNVFPENRIRFFSLSKDVALSQIYKKSNLRWPIAEIDFHKTLYLKDHNLYLARSILKNQIEWSSGSVERFLF